MYRYLVAGIFFWLLINPSRSQQAISGESLSAYIDLFISAGFDELYIEELGEELYSLIEKPVNINSRSYEEISRLFFLTEFQVNSLLNYTLKNGALISLHEINYITGFDKELLALMSPFVVVQKRTETRYPGKARLSVLNSLIYSSRDTVTYSGLPLKFVNRSSYEKGRIKLGFSYEKDMGETFLYEKYKPEFTAAYLQVSLDGVIKQIIIGDFRTRYGQGLVAWQGYSPSSSPLNTGLLRTRGKINPYASTDENNFYRGLAFNGQSRDLNFSAYISSNRIDAGIYTTGDNETAVSNLYESGLHNTENGESKRNTLTEYSAGGNINYTLGKFHLGSTVKANYFSLPFIPEEHIENSYDFRGRLNLVFASDYSLSYKRLYLFGEGALNASGSFALLQGLRLIPAERAILNFMWTHCSKGYTSFHGQVSGKETYNSFTDNFLANISLDLAPGIYMDAGILRKKDLWYGYRSASFPESTRYIGRLRIESLEFLKVTASVWHRQTLRDKAVDTGIESSEYEKISSARINVDLTPLDRIRFVSRFEICRPEQSNEKGILAYQDVRINFTGIPLSFNTRIYTFSTSSYESRIYTWENDLLYNPAIQLFYGRGFRISSLLDYGISEKIKSRLKLGYSEFVRNNTPFSYWEVKLQLRISI
ncbi:MAG: hypothetical protein V2I37_03380 [Marinilabiliaceae bacterium]|jgi:hypothetical protein|nr:hypothetical protein [Marinilabiliaceae bacterium]